MIKLVVVVVALLLIVVRGFNYNSCSNRWISKSLSIKPSYKVPILSSPIVSLASLKRLTTSSTSSTSLYVSTNDDIIVTDEELEEWLDDMMYSGDINGYIDRNSR